MTNRVSIATGVMVVGVVIAATVAACGSANDATLPSEPTGVEQPVNPDITPEQSAFVADLLAMPLPEDEAAARIEEAGYTWRLGTIDGEPQAVTMDYRIDRLTLTTQDGLVIDATWG
ncbi:MAG: hypothetical protein ACO3YU_05920 [Candidatus Nanopelagicales bacterium]